MYIIFRALLRTLRINIRWCYQQIFLKDPNLGSILAGPQINMAQTRKWLKFQVSKIYLHSKIILIFAYWTFSVPTLIFLIHTKFQCFRQSRATKFQIRAGRRQRNHLFLGMDSQKSNHSNNIIQTWISYWWWWQIVSWK